MMFNYFPNKLKQFLCLSLFLIAIDYSTNAQTNLVINGSFEDYTYCPYFFTNTYAMPTNWYIPSNLQPVYANACSPFDSCRSVPFNCTKSLNYQPARTGNAYIFLDYFNGLNGRQYIQSQLKDSLKYNHRYYVEFYANLPNTLKFACNNNGLLFTNNAKYVDTLTYPNGSLAMQPSILGYGNPTITDTLGWQKISAIYIAKGGERFITVGNINTDAQTTLKNVNPTGYHGAGYIIDDVSVYDLDSFCLKADAGRDTTISINDSVFIGSLTNGIDTIKWYNAAGQIIDSTRPGFWVKPNATGSYMYVVEQTVNGCYSRDTVWVNVVLPLAIKNYELRIRNEKQVENIWQTANEINVSHYNIQRSINAKDFTTIGTVKAKNKSYNEYEFIDDSPLTTADSKSVYYRIEAVDKDGKINYSSTKQINLSTTQLISIFPNPAKDVVNIESEQPIDKLLMIDYLGREVIQSLVNGHKNYQLFIMNHPLPKGLYMLQVRLVNGETINSKLMVQ